MLVRKEVAAYLCSEVTVDRKVVPLQYVADYASSNHRA
jgi:hypothetical protein